MRFPPATQALLDRHGFDEARFAAQRASLARAGFDPGLALVAGPVESVAADALFECPAPDKGLRDAHEARGLEALRRGEVALVMLAGGMATRFGGVAKACSPCLEGQSFLQLRLSHLARQRAELGLDVPVALMTSFATEAAISAHLAEHARFGLAERDVLCFGQGISVRLTPEGEPFLEDDGAPSLYAPGHGDLPWAMARAGVTQTLRARGVRTLFVCNVDNMGANVDPAVLGAHLALGAPMSAETVGRLPTDVGGGAARIGGRDQLVEGFRLPQGVDHQRLLGFNTNTFYLSVAALDPARPAAFHPVAKQVSGRRAVQFERILGELSEHLDCRFLQVSRELRTGRFLPVKTPEDLRALVPVLEARYR